MRGGDSPLMVDGGWVGGRYVVGDVDVGEVGKEWRWWCFGEVLKVVVMSEVVWWGGGRVWPVSEWGEVEGVEWWGGGGWHLVSGRVWGGGVFGFKSTKKKIKKKLSLWILGEQPKPKKYGEGNFYQFQNQKLLIKASKGERKNPLSHRRRWGTRWDRDDLRRIRNIILEYFVPFIFDVGQKVVKDYTSDNPVDEEPHIFGTLELVLHLP